VAIPVPAAIATAIAATASAEAPASARALLARARFVYSERAAVEVRAVKLRDSLVGFLSTHFYEGKTPGAARLAVRHYIDRINLTRLLEQSSEVVFRRIVRQVSNKYSFTHDSPEIS
jgi:hypothetical protein